MARLGALGAGKGSGVLYRAAAPVRTHPDPEANRRMNAPTAWMPPPWLIALDFAGMLLLGLGLFVHYAPASAVAIALAPLRLPLLVAGGLALAAGVAIAVLLVLDHRRHVR
jgi:hypothetical protein